LHQFAVETSMKPLPDCHHQSSSQHFAVGQVVKVGDVWDVTVNSVKTSKGDQFSVPKSGNTYLIIDLTMKNISAQEQNVSSLVSFNLQDLAGLKYTETITTMSDIHPPDGKVEAGSPLRGQLVYEVPTSMKNYTLSFQEEKGYNMSSLSRKSDVSFKTVKRLWKDLYQTANTDTLEKLAKALGVSVRELLEDDPGETSEDQAR
jgi:DNA-binding Xre family transcriptional regulator